MAKPAVSLIIVSHKRPKDLERAIASLPYQSVTNLEVIVVSNQPPLVSRALNVPIQYIPFSEANISRARNLGVERATAPIVAFCDDDAVPDPHWLERLIEPFYSEPKSKNIAACGGFVRGRNGISYQWKAVGFTRNGADCAIEMDEEQPWTIFQPDPERYVKTVGTNCAFLRAALHEIAGYDEGFHYYLDDTDINKRLQDAGYSTAIVPSAQLIHNFTESRGRSATRVPQTLYNLGASTNLFLRQHDPEHLEENLRKFLDDQRKRLLDYFYFGLITSRFMRRLLRDLENGLVSGSVRKSLTPLKPIKKPRLIKRQIQTRALELIEERAKISQGNDCYPVIIRRYYTNRAARFGFHRGGYWMMSGGRFGRITRSGPIWRYRTRKEYKEAVRRVVSTHF